MAKRPTHVTREQARRYLRITEEELQRLIDKGELNPTEDGYPVAEVRDLKVYNAFIPKPIHFEHVEGKGSVGQPIPDPCTDCLQEGGVRYLGSDVLEGGLEYYHLVHTEVRNHFCCDNCGSEWSELQFL